MYKPEHFEAHELVPPDMLAFWGDKSFRLFDDHILRMLDNFRKQFGQPIWINRYNAGYTESGLRSLHTKTGASKSVHKKGRAFDLKTNNMPNLRKFIKERGADFYIVRVENFDKTIGQHQDWCHVEFGYNSVENIHFYNP